MKTVKVERLTLLSKVKSNRESHAAAVAEARQGYQNDLNRVLQEALHKIQEGKPDGIHKMINEVRKPESHLKDYDRVIAMLEMSQDAHIELSATEFTQLVQDEWTWRDEWTATNSKYLSS